MDTLAMAYSRKKAEQIVTGLERPLNRHLVKLIAFDAPPQTRAVWKRELGRWLREIAAIRVKPHMTHLKPKDLSDWLYEEPFGGVEEINTRFLIEDESEGFRVVRDAAATAQRLRELHQALGARLAAGDPAADLVEAL